MADFSVIVGKLHDFETAEDLAEYFRYCEIKAKPRSARECAISKFVESETGEVGKIVTNNSNVSVRAEGGLGFSECIEHTKAMTDFVRRYDLGFYPELVEDGFAFLDPKFYLENNS